MSEDAIIKINAYRRLLDSHQAIALKALGWMTLRTLKDIVLVGPVGLRVFKYALTFTDRSVLLFGITAKVAQSVQEKNTWLKSNLHSLAIVMAWYGIINLRKITRCVDFGMKWSTITSGLIWTTNAWYQAISYVKNRAHVHFYGWLAQFRWESTDHWCQWEEHGKWHTLWAP